MAYALLDSPVGQLAWSGQLLVGQDPDFVLTNVMLYWLTGTAGSAARFYYENAHDTDQPTTPTTTPTGVAVFRDDFQSIRRYAERDHSNIVHWSEFDRGGHYAAHEAPDLLVEDVRAFFRGLRG